MRQGLNFEVRLQNEHSVASSFAKVNHVRNFAQAGVIIVSGPGAMEPVHHYYALEGEGTVVQNPKFEALKCPPSLMSYSGSETRV